MTYDEIYNKVVALVANYFEVEAVAVTAETNITKDLNADSISIMEFILAMEDEFGIEISDEDAENIVTVKEIASHLEEAVNK